MTAIFYIQHFALIAQLYASEVLQRNKKLHFVIDLWAKGKNLWNSEWRLSINWKVFLGLDITCEEISDLF